MHAHSHAPRSGRSSRGFTLVEVLISILVFSFGLMGAAALQALAVQMATQNGDRARAAALANEMVTSLWNNQSSTPTSSYLTTWTAMVSNAAGSGLPNGSGSVAACTGIANCAVITITWRAPSAKSTAQASQYQTSVVIQ